MNKTKLMVATLGLGLFLGACSQPISSSGTPSGGTSGDSTNSEIPFVPRTVATGNIDCSAAGGGVNASLAGPNMLDRGTLVRRLSAQTDLPGTVQDMLYSAKSIINNMYYGYSTVDLQALHQQAYLTFKKTYPNALASYYVDDTTDTLMDPYIDGVQDHHTFYLNATNYANYTASSQGQPLPTPKFGLNTALVPNGDGLLITDVRGDGPAFAAGLRRGDVILSINGTALTRTAGKNDDDQLTAFAKVLSDAAASQTSTALVVRHGAAQRNVQMTAAILNGSSLPWGEVYKDANGVSHYYLRIPTFSGVGIAQKVNDLVHVAQASGAADIIVDLRNNGGGYLTEYVGAVAAFVPDQAGETVRYVDASEATFKLSGSSVSYTASCSQPQSALALTNLAHWTGKVAVLLNKYSASASEMFSQNIRTDAQAILIGETTYGVSNTTTFVMELPGYPARGMSITAGRVLLPNGQPADVDVVPPVNSPEDLTTLAASGQDTTLQVAYDQLDK